MKIQSPVVALMILVSIVLIVMFAANDERFHQPIMVDNFDFRVPASAVSRTGSATPAFSFSPSAFDRIEATPDEPLLASDDVLLPEDELFSGVEASSPMPPASSSAIASVTRWKASEKKAEDPCLRLFVLVKSQ